MKYHISPELKELDPEIHAVLVTECQRQEMGLELIASENYASPAVMHAQGSVLTNKYAEGYPGKRYYGGCQYVDTAETLAIDRLRKLFRCDDSSQHPYEANVQPHSGAQANMAVFLSFLKPGDTVLGLDLSHGGHLTHGSPVNFSGIIYQAHHYEVNKDSERLDYEEILAKAKECQPKLIIAGFSAYSRTIEFAKLREIADAVGAYLLTDIAHIAGLVAADLHPSPIPYADFVTSTTHKTLRGPRGGIILSKPGYGKKINSAVFPGMQGGPLMHTIAAKAVAFGEALMPEFKLYQEQVIKNAKVLADSLIKENMRLVSGGTDNHLMLIDVGHWGLTGKLVEKALDQVHITVNKNTIPFDQKSPFITSGIRLGTPALTTRGMREPEMKKIAECIAKVCQNLKGQTSKNFEINSEIAQSVKNDVFDLCRKFPIYK